MAGTICSLISSAFLICLAPEIGVSQSAVDTDPDQITGGTALKIPISDIIGLSVDKKSNGYLIRIECTKQLPEFESWLKRVGGDTWVYITFANAKADVSMLQDFTPTALVKKILIFESETSVQLTFMLKGNVKRTEFIRVEDSQDILVAAFTPNAPVIPKTQKTQNDETGEPLAVRVPRIQ